MQIDEKLVEEMLEDYKDYNISIGPNGRVTVMPGPYNAFYIEMWLGGARYITDSWIAFKLGIDFETYSSMLQQEYNAFMIDSGLMFSTADDGYRACKWIESLVIMKTLGGI